MKTIVISAVNIVEAGPLVILKDCLSYLSGLAATKDYKVIAIVNKRSLAEFQNIEYIETQWPKKNWFNRLWYEYVVMKSIGDKIGSVYLWFSLHDTSPRVKADIQAVYCHNAFSFYKWKWREILFAPKIVLFSIFTKYIYAFNISANKYLVVQQNWFREFMVRDFNFSADRVIVAKPNQKLPPAVSTPKRDNTVKDYYSFLFPASPNSHKNFECICEAVEMLAKREDLPRFKVYLTINGSENAYTKWLFKKWGEKHEALCFVGFLKKEELFAYYEQVNCLVFPSKSESWGLPISEFANYEKPMLLADRPYAQETAAGSKLTAFFNPDSPEHLAEHMRKLIQGNLNNLGPIENIEIKQPVADNWAALFDILLKEDHESIASR